MNAPNWIGAHAAAKPRGRRAPGPVILMLADGASFTAITTAVGCYPDYINRWKQRFESERLAGLASAVSRATADGADARPRGARPGEDAPESRPMAARTGRRANWRRCWASVTCWSRACGAALGSRPHRFERYMLSDDPRFEEKAADVIGLYLNPPQHAVVFAADEKTAIQALDRLDPVLPLSPGRAERHGFEYFRHGTLSLYAALNTKTGEIIGQTVPRHTECGVRRVPRRPRRHPAAPARDSRDCRQPRRPQDQRRPGVPGGASSRSVALHADLRVVAESSRTLVRQRSSATCSRAGSSRRIPDLARKIRRYITRYNEDPKPIRWTYSNPAHRITTDSAVTGH